MGPYNLVVGEWTPCITLAIAFFTWFHCSGQEFLYRWQMSWRNGRCLDLKIPEANPLISLSRRRWHWHKKGSTDSIVSQKSQSDVIRLWDSASGEANWVDSGGLKQQREDWTDTLGPPYVFSIYFSLSSFKTLTLLSWVRVASLNTVKSLNSSLLKLIWSFYLPTMFLRCWS